jgi:hypothetical protein
VWRFQTGIDADRRVPVLLRLHRVRRIASAQAGRLLRLLFIWVDALSAHAGKIVGPRRRYRQLRLLTPGSPKREKFMSKASDVAMQGSRDLVRQPVSALLWWCLPIAAGVFAAALRLPERELASVWAMSFAWMAVGCLLNAHRCHRLHCYISGPVFLLGSGATALLALDVLHFGSNTLSFVATGTFALALASFLPEFIWRRYA